MKHTVKDAFFNYDKKGNAKKVSVGTELSQKEYDKLTPQKKAKCEPKARVYRDQWDYAEDALVGHAYDEMVDATNASGETELVDYLSTIMSRTRASLHMKVAQIKKGDTFYNGGARREGLMGSNQIHQIMMEINPNRYQY